MKIVWHAPLVESEWFLEVFGPIITEEIFEPEASRGIPDCIHVVSSNVHPLQSSFDYLSGFAGAPNSTLLHASDEWFSGGYGEYGLFDRVIRTHETWLARNDGILTIPLGYPKGLRGQGVVMPASRRAYTWFFAGQVKASRYEMVREFEGLAPALLVDTMKEGEPGLNKEEYRAALADSVFIPCPMGNVMAETWRLYEALEQGAIPIVERRATLDYYRNVFGSHPIPTFTTWRSAAVFAREKSGNPLQLDELQHEVMDWWSMTKQRVRAHAQEFLGSHSHRLDLAKFSHKPRNRVPAMHEVLRLTELVRHQSPRSLARRVAAPAKIFQRIRRESLTPGP